MKHIVDILPVSVSCFLINISLMDYVTRSVNENFINVLSGVSRLLNISRYQKFLLL